MCTHRGWSPLFGVGGFPHLLLVGFLVQLLNLALPVFLPTELGWAGWRLFVAIGEQFLPLSLISRLNRERFHRGRVFWLLYFLRKVSNYSFKLSRLPSGYRSCAVVWACCTGSFFLLA